MIMSCSSLTLIMIDVNVIYPPRKSVFTNKKGDKLSSSSYHHISLVPMVTVNFFLSLGLCLVLVQSKLEYLIV